MVEKADLAAANMYLDLLKKCLTRSIFPETYRPIYQPSPDKRPVMSMFYWLFNSALDLGKVKLVRSAKFDPVARAEGLDWPVEADTMMSSVKNSEAID